MIDVRQWADNEEQADEQAEVEAAQVTHSPEVSREADGGDPEESDAEEEGGVKTMNTTSENEEVKRGHAVQNQISMYLTANQRHKWHWFRYSVLVTFGRGMICKATNYMIWQW